MVKELFLLGGAVLFFIGPLAYYAIWYHRVMSGARRDLESMRNDPHA